MSQQLIPTLIISAIIFLSIIWILIAILLFVRKKFIPEGKVDILINDQKIIKHERGVSLLQALSENGIFVPSACGGSGTCGFCKGKVLEGGGTILPTETSHINRKMAAEHYRLFCQVKLKENLKIEIPAEIFGIKKWKCEVISNRNIATFIKELVVQLPKDETIKFKSGGYVQLNIPPTTVHYSDMQIEEPFKQEWDKMDIFSLTMQNDAYVTRAYSMANHPAEDDRVILNVRIATPPYDTQKQTFKPVPPGLSSSYIFSLKPGDSVDISGPYGEFFIQDTQRETMFIGGGAGMAPMRSHIFDLFKSKHTKRKASFWYGARSLAELFYVEDFKNIEKENENFSFHIALSNPKPEDDWRGYTGFIHQVIYDNYLKTHKDPEEIEYYICGPPLMLQATLAMLDNLGVPPEMIAYDNFGG